VNGRSLRVPSISARNGNGRQRRTATSNWRRSRSYAEKDRSCAPHLSYSPDLEGVRCTFDEHSPAARG
jgi:hypothetical protein